MGVQRSLSIRHVDVKDLFNDHAFRDGVQLAGVNSINWVRVMAQISYYIFAGLALGLMLGAIGLHLTILGIEVKGDGGYLFLLCVIVSVCSAFVLFKNKEKALGLLSFLDRDKN